MGVNSPTINIEVVMSKILIKNKSFTDFQKLRLRETANSTVSLGEQSGAVQHNPPHLDVGLKPTTIALPHARSTIDRFEPIYWRIDGPATASFSIVNYLNGWEATFLCRQSDDLVGIIWDSIDAKDHKGLAYETNKDYSGLKWEFDIELSPSMPVLNDETKAPTLTVVYENEAGRKSYGYIALKNYTDDPTGRMAHITIDWDTVKGGFNNNVLINVDSIVAIFFAGYVSDYDKVNPAKLAQTTPGYVRVTNSVVSGTGSKLTINKLELGKHDVGMCTSYDDHYDLNPARLVYNVQQLGYHGFINHYCGMSHYPVIDWNADLNKFEIPDTLTDGRDVVNEACKKWHQAYANALKANGFDPVFSVSWELYSLGAREEWCQREYDDTLGRTGYTPPSYFASLCNQNAITYLHKAYREFADILVAANLSVNMQIGEPWWWFNPSTLNPCVYDYQTRLAFNTDTGLFAPDLGDIFEAVDKTDATSVAFKDWLRHKLGQTCQDIRTMLKANYGSDTKVCPLIFFPSIRTHQVSLATYINYPQEQYAYPNFDYVMTEAYDWVIEQPPRLDLSHQAVNEIPIGELGYPANKVAYLTGFVPDRQIAYIYKFDADSAYRAPIWQRMFGDMENNKNAGIMKQLVWAYPQAMFDSLTIVGERQKEGFFLGDTFLPPIKDNTPYPAEIINTDAQIPVPPLVQKPIDVKVNKTSNGDYRIAFNVENEIEGSAYDVQVLNSTGLYPLWSKSGTENFAWIYAGTVADLNLGATIRIVVIPSAGDESDLVDLEPVLDDNYLVTTLTVTSGRVEAEDDITVSWTSLTGIDYPKYLVEQFNILDNTILYKRVVETTFDKYTAAEQRAAYGFLAGVVKVKITPLDAEGHPMDQSLTHNHNL